MQTFGKKLYDVKKRKIRIQEKKKKREMILSTPEYIKNCYTQTYTLD